LADGWFNPAPLKLFGKYNLRETLTIGEPQVIADIYMRFADREMIIGSDADWQYCEGAYTFNNIYLGERLDMKLFRGDNTTDLLMPDWKNVVLSNGPEGRLVSSFIPKINHTLSLGAEHIHVVDEETFIIDFGAIVTGFIDGGIGAPARAEQKDAFECRSGKNHFINAFTCHSFRYVQLSGINIEQLNNVQALSVHTVLRENGGFYCSDPYINKLFEVAKRTKLNNIHSVFGDCARERFAYGGDIVALARSQVYQFDSAAIYKKTIFDFINDIRPCGGVTETAPFMGIKTNGVGGETGPLGWQLVLPYLIAIHYRHYGNVNLLAESLPFLEKQILSLEMRDFDDLVTCCLGDWGSRVHDMRNYKNGSPALHFTSACFYYYHLLIIAKICDDLGFKEKWLKYIGKANKIREKILSLYKNTDGSFADRSQTSFVFAIYFDLCDDIESSLNALIDLIKKEQNVITCGIFGQSFAYEIFHRYGHNELILEWLRVEAGFKKMLKNDASTLKEFFGDNLNGSNNHAMFSSYSSWLFQALGGITVAEEAVGADVILISPSFTDTINFVDCWHQTIRGRIECRWRRYKKGIELVIKVPFNLKKCTLKLPKVYQLNKQLPAPIDCDTYHHFYDITDAGEIKVLL
ncbi:alpha-L-rhamnosidase C-terminal domain-containing protein, partial [Klebsiella pneumoniae]